MPDAAQPQDSGTVDPRMLAALFPQQAAQPTAAPPVATGSPQPTAGTTANPMSDYADLAKQQMTSLLQSPPAQEASAARAQGTQLAGEAASMPIPKTGWLDAQGKPQEGGFLHNLGRALMAIGGATTAGREIQRAQYEPGIQRYKAQQAGYAERIKASQEQAKGAEQEVGSEAQVAGRTIWGGASVAGKELTAKAFSERTQQMVQKAIMTHQDSLAKIAAMTDIAAKRNATEVEVTKMRDEMMTEITGMKDVTQEDVARIMAGSAQALLNTKIAEDPSIAGAIKRAFGLGGAQAPGGAQPVAGETPLPKRSASAAKTGTIAKGTHVWDNKGVEHIADGTQPLPKGWSTKKPGV